jgi:Flp pilus assembly CpaF family ATPase
MVDPLLIRRLHLGVAEQLARWREARTAAGGSPTLADQEQYASDLIAAELQRHAEQQIRAGLLALDQQTEDEIAASVQALLFRLGPLEPLLADPEVESIDVNGCDGVWLEYSDGTCKRGPALAASDEALVDLIQMIAARMGPTPRRFDAGAPRLNLRLPDGSRLFGMMGVSHRPVMSIRKHRFVRVCLEDLIDLGAVDAGLARFLRASVLARKNVVVSGAVNVGKTTMLRALLNEVPASERVVTIENAYELGLHEGQLRSLHPNVVALEARDANVEGEGAIGMADLVQAALRLNPSRVVVGEVLGDEILPLLNAMSQGKQAMGTIHAESSLGTFQRIAMYALTSPARLGLEATSQLVAGAVHFVVFLDHRDERPAGGRLHRFVSSVREVTGSDGPRVLTNEVYRPGPDGRALPHPGAPLRSLEDLERHGFDRADLDQPAAWWSP